jgi:5-methylcytosine-specific restriction endonuclease McrA
MMVRAVPEWQGATDDTKIPDRVRQRIFDAHDGCCHVCDIHIGGKLWNVDHRIAIANGGAHKESNLAPICIPCHREKNRLDVGIKSKIAAVKARHTGVKQPTGDLNGRGFDKVAPKEKAPQRASLPPRMLYKK